MLLRLLPLWQFTGIEHIDILLHFLEQELGILEVELAHVQTQIAESRFSFLHHLVELFLGFVAGHRLDQTQMGLELFDILLLGHRTDYAPENIEL